MAKLRAGASKPVNNLNNIGGRMKFKRFEEMPVWQDSRRLTTMVYEVTSRGKLSRDFGLREQIQRAAVSVMSNIAEGYERASRREFLHYLTIAKGSVGEVRSQLYVALDLKYITQAEFTGIYDHSVFISSQIANFCKYLRNIPSD